MAKDGPIHNPGDAPHAHNSAHHAAQPHAGAHANGAAVNGAQANGVPAAGKAIKRRPATPDRRADELWHAHLKCRSDLTRNALIEYYLPVVRFHAEKLRLRLPDGVDVEDLVQEGIFGVMKAIENFEPQRGFKFETFCAQRVHGSIIDHLRSMDWAPRLVRRRASQMERAASRFEAEHGRRPDDGELAGAMAVGNPEEYERIRRDAQAVGMVSMHQKWPEDRHGGRESGEAERLADPRGEAPLDEVARGDLKREILRTLSPAEKLVITLYYYENLTMREIGTVLELSESRVSQMHAAIIDRLKTALGPRALRILD